MKNYILLFVFLLCTMPAFAQTDTQKHYIITSTTDASGFEGQHYQKYNQLTPEQRDEIAQREFERKYDEGQNSQPTPSSP